MAMQLCTQCGCEFQPHRKNFRKTCSDFCLLRAKERIGTLNGGQPDPTPEEIAERAAAIRARNAVARMHETIGSGPTPAGIREIGGHMRGLVKVYR